MLIHSDWHIHSEASYDASLTLKEIDDKSRAYGFCKIGITDHANFNDKKFLGDLDQSARIVREYQKTCPRMVLGVELTPIEKPEFDHIAKTGTREGYIAPASKAPYAIELAQTKEELIARGVRYAIGAAHWRVDVPGARALPADLNACIREWHRQQMWLACDERVTILGHPWWSGKALWYEDFSVIPASMNVELTAALRENGKYAECNVHFFHSEKTTETFRRQYADFLRSLHEAGIPITYGSDAHQAYTDDHLIAEKYLLAAGFKDGDVVEIKEEHLW